MHGDTRIDNYDWMRDANWQAVLKHPDRLDHAIRAHLDAENAYAKAQLESSSAFTQALGDEFAARIIANESSVPQKDGDWEYWKEFRENANYPVYMRRRIGTAADEVIFDTEAEAKPHGFYDIVTVAHSPDHRYLAYSVDTKGSEYYTLRIRDLATGKDLPDSIINTKGSCVWAKDSASLFYIEQDNNHRAKWVKSHVIGTDSAQDPTLYKEPDDGFFLGIDKTESGDYLLIASRDHETQETRFCPAITAPDLQPQLIRAREKGIKYDVHHRGDTFYIRTNADGAEEYKIMTAPVADCGVENWKNYQEARPDVTIESIIVLEKHLVRIERANALPRIVIVNEQDRERTVDFPDAAYTATTSKGHEFAAQSIRVSYQSMANPGMTFDIDLDTGARTVRKQRLLPNGHDPAQYVVERFFIAAQDGAQVPVTLLRHVSVKADGTAPLFQYGYGSYGHISQAGFMPNFISLADRGVVVAIAGIRGSSDLGKAWHRAGRMENKKNTFTDFIDVTEALIQHGYGQAGKVCIEGRSAGGMLMGAVCNMRPDLYTSVIAGVPFVDVLNTMSDPSLPLTPPEWKEWGNPIADKNFYDLMKSYSPYDNIKSDITYPMILAPAGLTDPRVTYWEPTKWIARLRDEAKGGPFLLKMDMGQGHGGASARYDRARERADEYAICLQRWQDQGYDLSLRVQYPAHTPASGNIPRKK